MVRSKLKVRVSVLGLVTVLVSAAWAEQPRLGMTVSGVVQSADGTPCVDCRVLVYNTTVKSVNTARTNAKGEFRLTDLPAGDCTIAVIDASGNVGPLAWENDGEATRAISSDFHLSVEQGVNVEGVVLSTPPPVPVVPDDQLGPLVSEPRKASLAVSALACPDPGPSPVVYPSPPDPSNRIIFGAKRGDDRILLPSEDPCGRPTALGCTTTRFERVPRNVPVEGVPICRADGLLIVPTDVVHTQIELRSQLSNMYSSDPPTARGCAEIRKPDCGGKAGYHNFNGAQLHECTHRTLNEQAVVPVFDQYFTAIKQIQSEIDAKGRCYECCKKRELEAIQLYLEYRVRANQAMGTPGEPPAYAAECAYYKSRYANFCK